MCYSHGISVLPVDNVSANGVFGANFEDSKSAISKYFKY